MISPCFIREKWVFRKRASLSISHKQIVPDVILNTRYGPKDVLVKHSCPPISFPMPPDQKSKCKFVSFRIDNFIQKKTIWLEMETDFKIARGLLLAHRLSQYFRPISTVFPPWTFLNFRFFQNKLILPRKKSWQSLEVSTRPRPLNHPWAVNFASCCLIKIVQT